MLELLAYFNVQYISDVDPCNSAPCTHGGTCVRTGYTQSWTCACVSGYTGKICQTGKLVFIIVSILKKSTIILFTILKSNINFHTP